MNRLAAFSCIFFFSLYGCASEKKLQEAPVVHRPEKVVFHTSDIHLFWKMFGRESPLFTTDEIKKEYFKAGTLALCLFYKEKLKSAKRITSLLNSWIDRNYYENIRTRSLRVDEQIQPIIQAMQKLKKHYQQAVFPDIFFVIGALNDGGVVLRNGQIVVPVEMFLKDKDSDISYMNRWLQHTLAGPNFLPVIIVHELVHVQQRKFAINHNLLVGGKTLLDRTLLEGSAEFITKLITHHSLTEDLFSYANTIEKKLWRQFQKNMNQQNYSKWLYNGNNASGRRADLGYFIGYKICEAYYQNSPDKQQAVHDMIQIKNSEKFLKKSGYGEKF